MEPGAGHRFGSLCRQTREHLPAAPDGRVHLCNHTATALGDLHTQPLAEILAGRRHTAYSGDSLG